MRTSPDRSEPLAPAIRASSTEPTLAPTRTSTPSAVSAGDADRANARAAPSLASASSASSAARVSASGSTKSSPVRPSSAMVVPAGMARTPGPAATTAGIARDRARIALCPVGLPEASTRPRMRVRVQVGHLGRGQVVRDEDAVAVDPELGRSDQGTRDLLPDRPDVGGPRPQVRVGDAGELRRDRRDRIGPRPRSGRPGPDAVVDVVEQVGVVDQHQVRVEDPRLGLAHLPGGAGPDPLDGAACLGDRGAHAAPLGVRVGRLLFGDRHVGGEHARSPARSRCPATPAAAGRWPRAEAPAAAASAGSGSSKRRSARATTWSTRLPRLAAGSGHLDAVAAECAERGHAGQAGGRHRTRAGVEVAQLDAGVVQPRLLDQPRGGPGVQAMSVGDLDDRRRPSPARRPRARPPRTGLRGSRGTASPPAIRRPRPRPRRARRHRPRRPRRRRAPRRAERGTTVCDRGSSGRPCRAPSRRRVRRCRGPSAPRRRHRRRRPRSRRRWPSHRCRRSWRRGRRPPGSGPGCRAASPPPARRRRPPGHGCARRRRARSWRAAPEGTRRGGHQQCGGGGPGSWWPTLRSPR